jgi:hypothetical protein
MRKFILISALLLASVSAQASQSRSLILASNDEPKAVETAKPAEAKAEPKTDAKTYANTDATAEAAKPAKKVHAKRREGDEAKARRIAAKYGVYW